MKILYLCTLLLVLLALSRVTRGQSYISEAESKPVFDAITDVLAKAFQHFIASTAHLNKLQVDSAPRAFSWSNCGSDSDPTKLLQLAITPDPIVLGQQVTITAKGLLSSNIEAGQGYSLNLSIEKNILGLWVPIPCIDGIGSCSYDLCSLLPPNTTACPLKPWGIPCSCPLPSGSYTIPPPGFSIVIPNPGISWLVDGDFKVSATLNGPSGRLACYELDFSLSSN